MSLICAGRTPVGGAYFLVCMFKPLLQIVRRIGNRPCIPAAAEYMYHINDICSALRGEE